MSHISTVRSGDAATLSSAGNLRQAISFWVRDEEYCVDILGIEEIRGWTPTTPIPNAAPHMRGVINIRGAVVPIFDLGARFGFGLTQPGPTHVVIVVSVPVGDNESKKCGLLVDGVNDIITIAADEVCPSPEGGAFLDGLVTVSGRMVGFINIGRLFAGLQSL